MNQLSVIWILLVLLQLGLAEELRPFPKSVTPCKNRAEYSECFKKNVIAYKELLATGSEEFQVPTLEPFYMENFIVTEKTTSNGLRISASDVRVYNASKFILLNMKCEYPYKCVFDITFPNLYVTSTYHVDGQIVALPIKGDGPMIASFADVQTYDNTLIMGTRMKNGVEYGKMKSVEVHTKFKKGFIRLDNLFNGDKLLGDAVNEAVNANIEILAMDIRPVVEKALNREFRKSSDKILRQYTAAQLWPQE